MTSTRQAALLPAVEAELSDRKNRRVLPHHTERAAYVPIDNEAAKDGYLKVAGARWVVFAMRSLSYADQRCAMGARIKTGRLP
ncbi:hypothetical protein [Paraburkholderia adhaesiva]|uniref:hypothetical protein n=1 Tax=Paraburkholderia adhaesiva TaxID=2883244 RepID=UPI001F278A31|nr:hypothetical protein [Paraburkholderia adhaesiva]